MVENQGDQTGKSDVAREVHLEHAHNVRSIIQRVLDANSSTLPQPAIPSTLTPEQTQQAQVNFELLRQMVDTSQDPLEKMLLTSPEVVGVVMGIEPKVDVYPEEAARLDQALVRVGAQDRFVFLLEQDDEVIEFHDSENFIDQPNASFEPEWPVVTFTSVETAKQQGADLVKVSGADITSGSSGDTVYMRLQSKVQAIEGETFELSEREESEERNMGYLKAYLAPYAENLRALNDVTGLIDYLDVVRKTYTSEEFADAFTQQVGYLW